MSKNIDYDNYLRAWEIKQGIDRGNGQSIAAVLDEILAAQAAAAYVRSYDTAEFLSNSYHLRQSCCYCPCGEPGAEGECEHSFSPSWDSADDLERVTSKCIWCKLPEAEHILLNGREVIS